MMRSAVQWSAGIEPATQTAAKPLLRSFIHSLSQSDGRSVGHLQIDLLQQTKPPRTFLTRRVTGVVTSLLRLCAEVKKN